MRKKKSHSSCPNIATILLPFLPSTSPVYGFLLKKESVAVFLPNVTSQVFLHSIGFLHDHFHNRVPLFILGACCNEASLCTGYLILLFPYLIIVTNTSDYIFSILDIFISLDSHTEKWQHFHAPWSILAHCFPSGSQNLYLFNVND